MRPANSAWAELDSLNAFILRLAGVKVFSFLSGASPAEKSDRHASHWSRSRKPVSGQNWLPTL
jgi:hypothetical protein